MKLITALTVTICATLIAPAAAGHAAADTVTPPTPGALSAPWAVDVVTPDAVVVVTNWATIKAGGGCTLTTDVRYNGTTYTTGAVCPTPGTVSGTFAMLTCGVQFRVTINAAVVWDSVPLPCPPPPVLVPVTTTQITGALTFTNTNAIPRPATGLLYTKVETALSAPVSFVTTRVGHRGHPAGNRFLWIWIWDGYSVTLTVPASSSVTVVTA